MDDKRLQKNCPFCGGNKCYSSTRETVSGYKSVVRCHECGAEGPELLVIKCECGRTVSTESSGTDHDIAWAAWNRRM
jgi:hypothetical protein